MMIFRGSGIYEKEFLMGWKSFKSFYGIEHIVHIRGDFLLVGSIYIPDAITFSVKTGDIHRGSSISDSLFKKYDRLKNSSSPERLSLIGSRDIFSESNPIFYYSHRQNKIIEDFTEKYEWPNVTHKGSLIYENTHFKTKKEALAYAIRERELSLEYIEKIITDAEKDILDQRKEHKKEGQRIKDLKSQLSKI
jgi:hypothetical protein